MNHHGGVVIPSHPYRGGNSMGDLLFELPGITAVEGMQRREHARHEREGNGRGGKLDLPYTGGSDAHGQTTWARATRNSTTK